MNKLTALTLAGAMLALGTGGALGQRYAGGNQGHERWHGDAGWEQPRFAPYGSSSYVRAYPYVYRIPPAPNYFFPYGTYVPPVAGYRVPRYIEYPAFSPKGFIMEPYVFPTPLR